MRHSLVINPNTGQATTLRLHSHLQTLLPSDVALDCINARFGAPYIACEASHAVASHALLDAWSHHLLTHSSSPDGVIIACFGDPGLFALREASAAPVTGLAEASIHTSLSARGIRHRDWWCALETYARAPCLIAGLCFTVAACVNWYEKRVRSCWPTETGFAYIGRSLR
jgi:hypothetical protein